MKYDIFLTCAPKDFLKLPYVLEAIENSLSGYDEIVICVPYPPPDSEKLRRVRWVGDQEVLPVNPMRWKYRPGWIYQQFLKLFQDETKNRWYVTIDCDTILNRPLPLFDGDKPIWYHGWPQHNHPYYNFNMEMLELENVYKGTFLADMNFFNKDLIAAMLKSKGYTPMTFIEKSFDVIDDACYPSEADLYGQWVEEYRPGLYIHKQLRQRADGRTQFSAEENKWSETDIRKKINMYRDQDLDTIAMHSWFDNNEDIWS